MKDPRIEQFAKGLIEYSTELKAGEKVLIEAFDVPHDLVNTLIKKATEAGAIPFITVKNNLMLHELYKNATEEQMKLIGKWERARMEEMDAYIGIRGSNNISEMSDVPGDRMKLYQKHWLKPVHLEVRVPKTKWVIMRYPSPSMAQQAGMSTEAFEEFYFNVCILDYAKMDKAMDAMAERMNRTDKVRIKGPGTDLTFSIKGIGSKKCAGKLNIPDGEIFTAPVKNSVNGKISYTAKTIYQGTVFENIVLEFKDGKIVKATCNNTEKLNEILDSDEGARYVGEFALGVNPYITRAMLDILFDEKICGSFHFTPGECYEECDNGNKSEIHWDMVCIQTPEYGGGEIWFDDEMIRKDGRFVPEYLHCLNPENLK
ncbi:MAG: aminopeptidase [Thermoplasmata archaeon HGW-Thermoplasmata-1]|nr:MAG: aminopeptidase [Thermoplasmata archaeon HGW-Thermoplasmata-1]